MQHSICGLVMGIWIVGKPRQFLIDRVSTPIGVAVVISDEEGALRILDWRDHAERWQATLKARYGEIVLTTKKNPFGHSEALEAYLKGDIAIVDRLKVAFAGTEFQERVWQALRKIPGGTTLSYGELAKRIGNPSAMRAVGLANGANPIGIVVPCHRVIGSDGSLTGYGGGIERKRWLLAHEARYAGRDLFRQRSSDD